MDLLLGTVLLRPYVFGFLAAFLAAGASDLGWRRTLLFGGWVWPLAWLAEFASTRVGVPFGLYHYTGHTRGRELFIANVPFMDSLSFTFLAYAAFCLARAALTGRRAPVLIVALLSGVLMMLLDLVIDPLAVRGDRWFLGRVFYYPDGGLYFGVPVSNFAGWVVVGMVSIAAYCWSGVREAGSLRGWPGLEGRGSDTWGLSAPGTRGSARPSDPWGRRVWPGAALYYGVLVFNLVVAGWIGEWLLMAVGVVVHAVAAAVLWGISQRPAARLGLENQRA